MRKKEEDRKQEQQEEKREKEKPVLFAGKFFNLSAIIVLKKRMKRKHSVGQFGKLENILASSYELKLVGVIWSDLEWLGETLECLEVTWTGLECSKVGKSEFRGN